MLIMSCHLAYVNDATTFQKVMTKTFNKYMNQFMQVFLDDFSVFGQKEDNFE